MRGFGQNRQDIPDVIIGSAGESWAMAEDKTFWRRGEDSR
jgi:hypothetical protein